MTDEEMDRAVAQAAIRARMMSAHLVAAELQETLQSGAMAFTKIETRSTNQSRATT